MSSIDTCALCPRLCRTACPVATGTGREAAVPSWIASAVLDHRRGMLSDAEAASAVTLCVDCGACEDRCHIHQPLPTWIQEARAALVPAPVLETLRPVEGDADLVMVETDGRPAAKALASALGRPVARWVTRDRLGVEGVAHPSVWRTHAAALRAALGERTAVVADGGAFQALKAADLRPQWLHQLVAPPEGALGSCACGGDRPIACCGGAGPLPVHHPVEAARVGAHWVLRAGVRPVLDARCRTHLGGEHRDMVDHLLAREDR